MIDNQKEQIASMRRAGASYAAVAATLGLSRNTVKSYCQRNIYIDSTPEINHANCEMCSNTIIQSPGYRIRRFCSDTCRMAWWNAHRSLIRGKAKAEHTCTACGKRFTDYPNHKRKYCSHACYIAHRYGAQHV